MRTVVIILMYEKMWIKSSMCKKMKESVKSGGYNDWEKNIIC